MHKKNNNSSRWATVFVLAFAVFLAGCSQAELGAHIAKQIIPPSKTTGTYKIGNPYKVAGKTYYPREDFDLVETGIASWYGAKFHGRPTANGETFNMYELTAAHRTLQLPSLVRVTNLENGRSLVVRVNDRGPYKRGRVIDLSMRSAELLGFKGQGTTKIRLQVLKKESMALADAAKRGIDTGGVEIAMNRHKNSSSALDPQPPGLREDDKTLPRSYQQASFQNGDEKDEKKGTQAVPLGAMEDTFDTSARSAARGLTDVLGDIDETLVSHVAVPAKSRIFVQAGAFTVKDNAMRLAQELGGDVYPTDINGRLFYRVRLGPFAQVGQADTALASLVSKGNQSALIVVD